MSIFSMTLDIILASLLVIAILYCWRLDRKLKSLRSGRDGMIEAARELQSSVDDARSAIERLRQSAEASGRDLQLKIDEARAVATMPPPAARGTNDFALRRRSAV
jgi:hypothetical protein